MAMEIERKFLVGDDSWRAGAGEGIHYRQGYLSNDESCSIRVRVAGKRAWLGIKSATAGVSRREYEYPIPWEDAEAILGDLCSGPLIEKTRYRLTVGAHTWEIDVFEGDNEGLVVAEIELSREDEVFGRPTWLGPEVSDDPRYYNACLAERPYRTWAKA